MYFLDSDASQVRALRPNAIVHEVAGTYALDYLTAETGASTSPLRTQLGQASWLARGPANDISFSTGTVERSDRR